MKKIILCGLIPLCVCSHAYALDDYGFYLGGDITATWWTFNVDTDFTDPVFSSDGTNYSDDDWNYSALGRLGGYFLWGDDDYLFTALEFFGSPHDVFFEQTEGTSLTAFPTNFFQQTTEATYSLGGQLKQGMFFDEDLLGFVTAGLVYTQYKVLTNFVNNVNFAHRAFVSNEEKFYLPGFRFGAGVEWFATENLGLDLQATYTLYDQEDLSVTSQDAEQGFPVVGPIGTVNFDPSALQIGAGVNFYF